MRIAAMALVVCGIATSAASAQSESWAQKMFSDGVSHNFGTVPRGAKLSHRFNLTNIYAVPLQITSTRVSCGCVTVTPAKETLQSKETAFIDVAMDARRFTGPKTVSVYVTFGPQYTSTAVLEVSANSRPDVVFNPGEVNFGIVGRGQTPTQVIDVEYAGSLDWRVSDVVTHNAPFHVTFKELYRRRGEVGYQISVTLKADAPPGSLRHELLLKTNDPASPHVPVLVEGTIQASFSVVPDKVKFPNAQLNTEVTSRVRVGGSQPFRIASIEGLGDGLEADIPNGIAAVQIVTLKLKPGRTGDFQRKIQIKTRSDQDKETTVIVTVEGSAVQ